jgi:hypothetical protein
MNSASGYKKNLSGRAEEILYCSYGSTGNMDEQKSQGITANDEDEGGFYCFFMAK